MSTKASPMTFGLGSFGDLPLARSANRCSPVPPPGEARRCERRTSGRGPDVTTTVAYPDGSHPASMETSVPGIFAVGDVRSGSVKRVASAVGEGSIVISDVHRALAAARHTVTG